MVLGHSPISFNKFSPRYRTHVDLLTTLEILEYTGLISGLLYVYGATKEKIWSWPVGLIFVVSYGISAYHYDLLGEVILQVGYFFLTLYGWMQWSKKGDAEQNLLQVSSLNKQELLYSVIAFILLFLLFYYLIVSFRDQFSLSLPFWDGLTSAGSIVATYLIAKKKIDGWYIWVVINAMYVGIMLYKGITPYAILYGVYFLMSFYGLYQWKNNYESREAHA